MVAYGHPRYRALRGSTVCADAIFAAVAIFVCGSGGHRVAQEQAFGSTVPAFTGWHVGTSSSLYGYQRPLRVLEQSNSFGSSMSDCWSDLDDVLRVPAAPGFSLEQVFVVVPVAKFLGFMFFRGVRYRHTSPPLPVARAAWWSARGWTAPLPSR